MNNIIELIRRQARAVCTGRRTAIDLDRSREVPAQYALVGYKRILPSHDAQTFGWSKGFPRRVLGAPYDIQGADRDYSRKTSLQMGVITDAANLKPRRLITNTATALDGPPILASDAKTVLSGNGRTIKILCAIAQYPENYDRYLEHLTKEIEIYGMTAEQTREVQYPILVRVTELDARSQAAARLADRANQSMSYSYSDLGTAASLSHFIGEKVLQAMKESTCGNSGKTPTLVSLLHHRYKGKAFRHAIRSALPLTERDAYFDDDGILSERGRTMIGNALFLNVWDDPAAVSNMPKRFKKSMLGIVPQLIELKRSKYISKSFNILPELREVSGYFVTEKYSIVRGKKLLQLDMFAERPAGIVQSILLDFLERTKKLSVYRETFARYITAAKGVTNIQEGGMFKRWAKEKNVTKVDLVQETFATERRAKP